MRSRDSMNPPEALVLTMVLVAAADGGMSDREIGIMSGQVQTLPVFQDFTRDRLIEITDRAVRLLHEDDGLAHAGRLLRSGLNLRLRETAYALACEIVAGGRGADRQQSLDMLEYVRGELDLDPLISAAIERGVRARYHNAPDGD